MKTTTIDYSRVTQALQQELKILSYNLIEKIAEEAKQRFSNELSDLACQVGIRVAYNIEKDGTQVSLQVFELEKSDIAKRDEADTHQPEKPRGYVSPEARAAFEAVASTIFTQDDPKADD